MESKCESYLTYTLYNISENEMVVLLYTLETCLEQCDKDSNSFREISELIHVLNIA